MDPDDEVCLCFHVTRRKVEQYIRVRRPRVVSELSQCFGAGTGCGWCRPYLKRLLDAASEVEPSQSEGLALADASEISPTAQENTGDQTADLGGLDALSYAQRRERYRQAKRDPP